MGRRTPSRRTFLMQSVSGFGAAWVATNYSGILAAERYVRQAARSAQPAAWAFFSPAQAMEVEAMASQIIPTDDTPGAREAHVIRFIDRALVTFERDQQSAYTEGLKSLATLTAARVPGAATFSSLTAAQQIDVLTAMERTPFFNLVRTHTITGFFASPVHGGNADKAGWKLVNYDDALDYTPPFGYYDALPQPRR